MNCVPSNYRFARWSAAVLFAALSVACTGKTPLLTGTLGFVDTPSSETILSTQVRVSGWALDAAGVQRVDVVLDGRPFEATYGLTRSDVNKIYATYPNSSAAGFQFDHDFSDLLPVRHTLDVVVTARDGRHTTIGRKSVIPPQAMTLWAAHPEQVNPSLRPFFFLMATSGASMGGASDVELAYQSYLSRTTRVGIAVPILYLRTTKGAKNDWLFDPSFDVRNKCKDRVAAEDSLNGVIAHAIEKRLPVQFILNGGIWGDASCDTPEWDINDYLEKDIYNCQWSQDNVIFPDDYLKNLAGSTNSPELARSLTYNVFASTVRRYKKRNLQAAARTVAQFAHDYPDLFVGVTLDSDTYMNPFFLQKEWFDYNPGMIRQFRDWLRGTGPYSGDLSDGAPDLSTYRRTHTLTLNDVNRIARKKWISWDSVDPPRTFPGSPRDLTLNGRTPFWQDPWYQLWDAFRKHIVGLHYDELSEWVHEVGIPKDRIFSAQGFLAPDPGLKPFSIHLSSGGQNYDSAGVSIEGSIPREGHLGAIIYGEAAEDRVRMEETHGLFATFARMDPGWSVVEFNSTNLKDPLTLPTYAQAYHAFRDMFNFGARQVAVMAWNGSNGLLAGKPGYVAYTAWRNTPAEEAMRDFMVTHANLPLGSRLWTFGSSAYADDDGWTTEKGILTSGPGYLDVRSESGDLTLISPPDQVVRPLDASFLTVGVVDRQEVGAISVFARTDPAAMWEPIGQARGARLEAQRAGLVVPLSWPRRWQDTGTVVTQIRVVLSPMSEPTQIKLSRIALQKDVDFAR